jgi:signal transduction histidine kinase
MMDPNIPAVPIPGLDDVVARANLTVHASRPPDHEVENRALLALAGELASRPENLLQKLVETVLEVCRADSAGISSSMPREIEVVHWDALAGELAVPGNRPPVVDRLLVPIRVDGVPVGALWAVGHTKSHRFDAEDARLLASLSKFAAAGYTLVQRAHEGVRSIHDTYVHLVRNSPFGIYVIDADFRLWLASAGSQSVFAGAEPPIGRDFAELLRDVWAEPFATEAIGRFRHTLETGEPYHSPDTTNRLASEDGVASYDWKIERVRLPDGKLGVVCHFYDLTVRQQAEAALRQARDMAERASVAKSRFLSTLSHELRTPLTAVIGLSDLLETEVLGAVNPKQKEQLAHIKLSAWHLVTIIDEILTFTRSDAGQEEVNLVRVDVADIARSVVSMLAHEATLKGLRLQLSGADDRLIAISDGGKIRQIVVNLLGNALKYTDTGYVHVELKGGQDFLELVVADSGEGIPEDRLEEIFEPFVQVDQSNTREKGGTGLGLAICRRLAQLLGGDVTVRSTRGSGSTFILRLPRRVHAVESDTTPAGG